MKHWSSLLDLCSLYFKRNMAWFSFAKYDLYSKNMSSLFWRFYKKRGHLFLIFFFAKNVRILNFSYRFLKNVRYLNTNYAWKMISDACMNPFWNILAILALYFSVADILLLIHKHTAVFIDVLSVYPQQIVLNQKNVPPLIYAAGFSLKSALLFSCWFNINLCWVFLCWNYASLLLKTWDSNPSW